MSEYLYTVRLAQTAQTAAKTLVQIKAGDLPIRILEARVYQITKTTIELLTLQLLRKTAAATVTAATPLKHNPGDPDSDSVPGVAATGVNASAEGTDGEVLFEEIWSITDGTWKYSDSGRIVVPPAGIFGLKLATAPAASMTIGALIRFAEDW